MFGEDACSGRGVGDERGCPAMERSYRVALSGFPARMREHRVRSIARGCGNRCRGMHERCRPRVRVAPEDPCGLAPCPMFVDGTLMEDGMDVRAMRRSARCGSCVISRGVWPGGGWAFRPSQDAVLGAGASGDECFVPAENAMIRSASSSPTLVERRTLPQGRARKSPSS